MSDDEVALAMSLPLDSDGFLRRECPTCDREFKWFPNTDDEVASTEAPDGGYFCPYCGVQAPDGQWFTKPQIELATNMVTTQVVGPMLKDFTRGWQDIGRKSGGLLSVSGSYDEPDAMDPLIETDDMTRVDFACHPGEPVKVLDDWDGLVRCLTCGEVAS
jgi:hypothetical protein